MAAVNAPKAGLERRGPAEGAAFEGGDVYVGNVHPAEGAAIGAPQEEDAREVVREKQQILEVAAMAGFGLEIDENNRERIVNPETGERVVGTTTGPDGEMLLVAETEDGKRIFINPNDPDKQVKWVL